MIEKLRGEGMSIIYTTHYMEEAERLCDRVAIIDHGRIVALGTKDELVHNAFASRSEVLARFDSMDDGVGAWVEQRGGLFDNGLARFSVEHATDIAGLLDAAAKAGHELADVSLRKPNLESVFLHWTGRELRD
jgi:ABC-2 type transport system ATP-binding protein